MRRHWKLFVSMLVATGLVAAGGTAAATTSATGTAEKGASAPAQRPKGEPIKVGVMGPCESQTLQWCDLPEVVKVAERAVNANGGIKGRPLEVVYCDDKDDPNAAAECARKFVNEDQIVAAVGGVGRQGSALWAELQPAGIPWFGQVPVVQQDFMEPISYPFGGGIAVFQNFPLVLEDTDYKSAAVVHSDTPSGNAVFNYARQGYEAGGVSQVESIALAPDTVDYQPVVARLNQLDPDVWTSAQAAAQTIALLDTAADLGFDKPMVMSSASMDQQFIEAAASQDVDLRVVLSFAVSKKNPRVRQLNREVKKFAKEEIEDLFSDPIISSWLAVHVFAEIAEELDEVTPQTFMEYLNTTPFDTGMTAQLNFTQPGPVANFPRVVNVYALPGELRNGRIVQTSNQFQTAVEGAPPAVQPSNSR